MSNQDLLAQRYGQKPTNKKRQRVAIVAIGGLAVAVFLVWSISVTIANAQKLEGTLASFDVKSEQQVAVKVNVKRPENKAALCQVEALAQNYEVVGYKEVLLPKDQDSVSDQLSTVKLAVSAVVKECRFK